MDLKAAFSALRDDAGKIIIVAGAVSLAAALLFVGLAPLDQWVFAGCVLLGTTLLASGSVMLFGLHSSSFRSSENLIAFFLIAASIFAALAIISLVFGTHIIDIHYAPGVGQGTGSRSGTGYWTPEIPAGYVAEVEYPNAWLFMPLSVVALCLFIASVLLALRINKI